MHSNELEDLSQTVFEFVEDQAYFESLLNTEEQELARQDFLNLFDFRPVAVKRKEFNEVRQARFEALKQRHGLVCLLNLDGCNPESGLTVDHLIPIATNKLNKKLRGVRPKRGKKVPAQSFGSNHLDNLVLACSKCNGHKKHRLLHQDKLAAIFSLKRKTSGRVDAG